MKRAKLFKGITLALAFLLGVGSITTAFNMNRDNSAAKVEAAGYPDIKMESVSFNNGFNRKYNNGSFSVSNWSKEGTNPKAFDVDEGQTCTITYTPPSGIKIAQISVYFYSANLGLRVKDNRDQTSWKTISVEACNLGWKAYSKSQLWDGPYVVEIQNYNGGSNNHVLNFEMNIYYPWFNVYKDMNGRPGFDPYEIEPFAPSPTVQNFPTPLAPADTTTHKFKYWALDREGKQHLNEDGNIIYGDMMWEYAYIGVGGGVTIYAIWDIDYPVVMNKMGGTGGVDGIIVEDDSYLPEEIENGVPSRNDADFVSYWLEPGGQFTDGNTRIYHSYDNTTTLLITQDGSHIIKKPGKLTLYAAWLYWCDVVFDNNGGTSPAPTTTTKTRWAKPLPDLSGKPVPTRPGYEFLGYYDAKTGGKQYYDKNLNPTGYGTWDKNEEKPIAFYAQWKVTYFEITYKDQGGETFSGTHESGYPTKHTPGTDTELKSASKTGYTFGGWHLKSDCSDAAITTLGGDDFTDNITLYAKWVGIPYTVTFNKQGGEGGSDDVTATYGAAMPEITIPIKEHKVFTGYYDAPNGGTKYYNEDGSSARNWDKTDNTELYAQWITDVYIDITGTEYTWDDNLHTVGSMTFTDADTGVEITDYDLKFFDGTDYTLKNAPEFRDAGTHQIKYRFMKDGYPTKIGTIDIVINKAEVVVDPTPQAATGLKYTSEAQPLITTAGAADYGTMQYAVNTTGTLPEESEFSNSLPTRTNVGTYYVFYRSTGDSNHNPTTISIDNMVEVTISRVDRTNAINTNNEVKNYLNTLDDRFDSIKTDLESYRSTFEAEAITADNITEADVATKVSAMEAKLSEAKVAVTEQLINAIGEVKYSESKDAIEEAYAHYNEVLNETEKGMVDPALVELLNTDKTEYNHVDYVANLINAIPTPSATTDYYTAVDAAYNAYLALGDDEEAIINASTDKDFEVILINHVKAREVIEDIANIGKLTYNGGNNDSLALITSAETKYSNLTPAQKEIVNSVNYSTLTSDREIYDSVDNVVKTIALIGKVEHTDESKGKIDAARNAYDALLNEEAKELVKGYNNSYKTLDDAEHVYQAMVYIDDIGNPAYDTDPEGRIAKAREYYDSLTEDQKEQVGDAYLNVLVKAEAESAHITKVNTIWLIIGLVLSFLILVGAFFFIFFLLFKRRKDDDEDDENGTKNPKTKKEPVKAMSVGGGLTLVTLVSHYSDAPWIVLYIFAPLAFLALVACVILFILKRKGKGPFDKKRIAAKKDAGKATEAVSSSQNESEEEVETITDEKGNVFQIKYIKSFTAKLIQSPEETKKYYEELKNEVLSYKNTHSRVSWHYDAVNSGREYVLKFAIRGKTLCVYLPLNADDYVDSKYKVEKVESKRYEDVPCLYRIKNDRRLGYAKELIAVVAANLGLEKGEEQHEVYSNLPYEPNKPLVSRGLIKEQKIQVNKPATEPVVLETKTNSDGDEVVVTKDASGNIFEIRYIKSFTAKLSQSENVVKDYYTILKNYALSYKGSHSRVSWHYDAINVGRDYVLKFAIRGKTLCVYFALDASKLDEKYKVEVAKGKRFEDTPCLYRIKNDRRCEYAKELIDEAMKKVDASKGEEPNEDYHISKESTKALLEKGLIKELKTKVVDKKVVEHYESISVSKADEVMSDDKAESSIEAVENIKVREGKKDIINIDTLSVNFNDGDEVTLEALIEKGLVSPKVGYIKVLARGELDKKLTIIADDYSIQAVKMIVLTGGHARKIK